MSQLKYNFLFSRVSPKALPSLCNSEFAFKFQRLEDGGRSDCTLLQAHHPPLVSKDLLVRSGHLLCPSTVVTYVLLLPLLKIDPAASQGSQKGNTAILGVGGAAVGWRQQPLEKGKEVPL